MKNKLLIICTLISPSILAQDALNLTCYNEAERKQIDTTITPDKNEKYDTVIGEVSISWSPSVLEYAIRYGDSPYGDRYFIQRDTLTWKDQTNTYKGTCTIVQKPANKI